MSPRRVDQLLAGFADGDAISQEARILRQTLRDLGMASEIYAPGDRVSPGLRDQCRPLDAFARDARDAVICQYSIASEATPLFLRCGARRIVRYHNITPAAFFEPFDARVAAQLERSRAELRDVLACAETAWAVSEFNAAELRAAGARDVRVVPLFFDAAEFGVPPDPRTLRKFRIPLTNILFVGRMAPNKCVEDLILAFAWYHRTINLHSRLLLVGSEHSCPNYSALLHLLAARLNLPNVCFEGFVSHASRAAYYRVADVFVTASRHEGYCLPLVEAIWHGVPLVARMSGGMPEAAGGAGVLFDDLEPRLLAELIHRAAGDAPLRERVLASQAERLTALRARDPAAECRRLFV